MVELRSYQKQILHELQTMPAIGLFMGTGSGKTYTSLFRALDNGTSNLLVICPSKVVQQWEAVIKADFPRFKVMVFMPSWSSVLKNRLIASFVQDLMIDICIILSVESIASIPAILNIVDNDWTVIVDESHKIKEWGTKKNPIKRTHAVLAIGKKTESKIILTATPTQKDRGGYIDYFTQLQFLGFYTGWTLKDFQERYCIMQKLQLPGTPYPIQVIRGYHHTEEIESILQAVCRRYVAKFGDFEPQHMVVPIEKTTSYTRLHREKWYEDLDLTNLSARRMAKKGITTGVCFGHDVHGETLTYPDNTRKIDWLEEFLSDTDEPVVIFYKYNVELASLEALCKKLKKKYITINGKTKNKFAEVNKKGYEVVLGQFAAAGESLDGLQYVSHICVYFALPESSLEHRQALGRIDRDGQLLVPMYYYLVMQGTIDQDIWEMTQRKIEFSEDTLNRLCVEGDWYE